MKRFIKTPAADGESYPCFSISTSMIPNGNGTYTVDFTIFSDPSVTGGDIITNKSVYSLSPESAARQYDYYSSGTAVIKPKMHNGSNTYELVSYSVNHTW